MKVSVTKIPGSLCQIQITDSTSEFEKSRKEAIAALSKNTQVKGFRKGAVVPEAIIVKQFGEAEIIERALNVYLDRKYQKILEESKITPVSAGSVTAVASTSPIDITLTVEVVPEVSVDEKKLAKISIKKTPVAFDPKETEEALAEITKKFTHFHDAGKHGDDGFDGTETKIASGDRVTLDTQGFESKGGVGIPETKVQSFPLVIGSGQFIPGFEEKLIGHVAGDVVEFDITFPKDYHSDLFKGRQVFFMTTIFRVEKPHAPEWTPEFIEQLRGVKTDLAGFKEILKNEILGEKERRTRETDEAKLLEALREISTFEIGENMIAREVESIWNEQKSNLEAQGYAMKQYLEHMKTDEAGYKETTVKPEAERRVSAEIILREIRNLKKVEASDTEIQMEINSVIAQFQKPEVVSRLREKLVPGDTHYEDIKLRIAYRKVVDAFII